MACYLLNKHNLNITIPNVEDIDKVTIYNIFVQVGDKSWKVKHRYNDFVVLHEKLISDHCVDKDILPPKKMIGYRDPVFVEKRRNGLEIYLKAVVNFLQETMPRILAIFLDLHKYDIYFLLQEMSAMFLREGDVILSACKHYKFNPLQLHAISERLKQPCPPVEIFDRCYDFSHVLDFASQLVSAEVEGSWDSVGTSNIIPNKCPFELSVLKNLRELTLTRVMVGRIYQAGSLRQTLRRLSATQCGLQSALDVLLCDAVHKERQDAYDQESKWSRLEEVYLCQNLIKEFGNSLSLIPNVKVFAANENQITEVDDFSGLSQLTQLHLAANHISAVSDLHLRLPSITHLNLSQNLITSLQGFSSLVSLRGLDLGSNMVTDVAEVRHIQSLLIDYLVLTGNPVATIVDYRIKVLEYFGRRAAAICLDNEKPSQRELDTVAVVLALRVVKEGKTPVFSRTFEPTYPNSPQ